MNFPKRQKPVYGFYKGEYIGVMPSKSWASMHNTTLSFISEKARRRAPMGDWFFSYENKYEPTIRYEH